MEKQLFIDGFEAIAEHVTEALKYEITEQIDLVTVSESNDEYICNVNVAIEHLKIVLECSRCISEDEEIDEDVREEMLSILFDEPYYGFDVVEIIEDSDVEVDAKEFKEILISYLQGQCSIDDMEE